MWITEFSEVQKEVADRISALKLTGRGYEWVLEAKSEVAFFGRIARQFSDMCAAGVIDRDMVTRHRLFRRYGIDVNVDASGNMCVICVDATIKATDNSRVYACGKSVVTASDRASVCANGRACVYLSGFADAEAYGIVDVVACDRTTVNAYESATVKASGHAVVRAAASSDIKLYDNASCEAREDVRVKAYGHSSVTACDKVAVNGYERSVISATGNACVNAYDRSCADLMGNSTASLMNFSTGVAIEHACVVAYHSSVCAVYDDAEYEVRDDAVIRKCEKWCGDSMLHISSDIEIKGVGDTALVTELRRRLSDRMSDTKNQWPSDLGSMMTMINDWFIYYCEKGVLDAGIISDHEELFASFGIFLNKDIDRGKVYCSDAEISVQYKAIAYAEKGSRVHASGDAAVIADQDAVVDAVDRCVVKARGKSTVTVTDNCRVEGYGHTKIYVSGAVHAEVTDAAYVEARESAEIRVSGANTVDACGASEVLCCDGGYCTPKVNAHESAVVIIAGCSAVVKADGMAVVKMSSGSHGWKHCAVKVKAAAGCNVNVESFDECKKSTRYRVCAELELEEGCILTTDSNVPLLTDGELPSDERDSIGTVNVDASGQTRVCVYDNDGTGVILRRPD